MLLHDEDVSQGAANAGEAACACAAAATARAETRPTARATADRLLGNRSLANKRPHAGPDLAALRRRSDDGAAPGAAQASCDSRFAAASRVDRRRTDAASAASVMASGDSARHRDHLRSDGHEQELLSQAVGALPRGHVALQFAPRANLHRHMPALQGVDATGAAGGSVEMADDGTEPMEEDGTQPATPSATSPVPSPSPSSSPNLTPGAMQPATGFLMAMRGQP